MNKRQILRKLNLRKLKETGLKWSDISEKTGIDANYLSNIASETSDRSLGDDSAEKIEVEFDLGIGWFDKNHDGIVAEPNKVYEMSQFREQILDVPVFRANFAMGNGVAEDLDHYVIVNHVKLNRKFIRENLSPITSADNLQIVTGLGDSMKPTFYDGDQLFLDGGITTIEVDAVYAFTFNNQMYIKRMQRKLNGDLMMISDNDKYPPEPIENGSRADILVHGRIAGVWNFNKL